MARDFANFGGNVRFSADLVFAPRDDAEVISILNRHRDRNIRAVGRLHSWSDASVGRDVVLDLQHLNTVGEPEVGDSGAVSVTLGAGCTVDAALDHLRTRGYTLPTYGIVGRQTIAGAVSTATHGAGRSSLSHYVVAARVAAYDETGEARVFEWDRGDALRAARCAVGATGVLLSVRMSCEPPALIEEHGRWADRIEELLDLEAEYPRQQFYLVPWLWRWFAQCRRPLEPGCGDVSTTAPFHRVLRGVGVDIAFNGAVRLVAGWLRSSRAVRGIYTAVFPLLAQPGVTVTDHAHHLLMMRHDRFRHVEMELFVPANVVARAAAFIEWVLRQCGGEASAVPDILARDDFGTSISDRVAVLRGSYTHDYLITFRRVLRDDTLVSMTAGTAETWYAVSVLTYQRDLAPFYEVARFLARAMAAAYGARPHWGKWCPLDGATIESLYPGLSRFREQCVAVDPTGVFRNDFVDRLLFGAHEKKK